MLWIKDALLWQPGSAPAAQASGQTISQLLSRLLGGLGVLQHASWHEPGSAQRLRAVAKDVSSAQSL